MARFDIAIAGELNLDFILYGLPREMPTERELLGSDFRMSLGSSSAILAHNLAVLGSSVGFVTKVGDDSLGKEALQRLQESGADLSRVVYVAGRGSGLTIILPHEGDRHILTYPGTISELSFEEIDLDYLSSARHFHMSSLYLHKALLDKIPELFRRMKEAGLTTSLDTNDDPDDRWGDPLQSLLQYVDVLLPNDREARKIAGTDDLEHAIKILAARVPTLVVKLGANGAVAVSKANRVTVPGLPVTVVDPVGAGDSFDAGFLHQWLRGADLQQCLEFANVVGAFSTTSNGGTEAFRDREALNTFLSGHLTAPNVAQHS
jgi:sugar/nucleoside kinase (ribokinase family)